ncbi:MAG TPA: phage BR0599 family protein [Candidatus Hydrogenedentes bacterium]|nr:phage BR0599 family protein [Candidatus Hydrogenedentota bacterium]
MHESIRKSFEHGGKLALLGDLYLDAETLRLTNWDRTIRYTDPISGDAADYSPAPFKVSDDGVTIDPKETSILRITMSIYGYGVDEAFTAEQRGQFSQLMYDVDEYLDRNDIRGCLVILRAVNPDDLGASLSRFCGVVDEYQNDERGITLEVSEADDILSAPSYPVNRMCPFAFGDHRCGVKRDSAANKYAGTASGGSTSTIVDALIDPATEGYWDVAIVQVTSGANQGLARHVKTWNHATTTITVAIPFPYAIAAGDKFTLRRVCKKTYDYCHTVFNNRVRFGGYAFINEPIQGLWWRGKG